MTDAMTQEQLEKAVQDGADAIMRHCAAYGTPARSFIINILAGVAGRRLVQAGESMTNARLHGCEFDGWQCFHCSEVFTTVGGAADHFGATPDAMPGCLIRVQLGNERGLQMEIRRLEAELAKLKNHSIDDYGAAVNEIETGFQALLSALSLPAEEGDGLDMAAASCISHVLKSIAYGLKPLGIKRDDNDGSYRTSPTEALQPASPDKEAWRPIETAPKDGKPIIVFHPEGGVCEAFCPGDGFAWHCMDGVNTRIGEKSGKSLPTLTSFLLPPTHWMPLPTPPSDQVKP